MPNSHFIHCSKDKDMLDDLARWYTDAGWTDVTVTEGHNNVWSMFGFPPSKGR